MFDLFLVHSSYHTSHTAKAQRWAQEMHRLTGLYVLFQVRGRSWAVPWQRCRGASHLRRTCLRRLLGLSLGHGTYRWTLRKGRRMQVYIHISIYIYIYGVYGYIYIIFGEPVYADYSVCLSAMARIDGRFEKEVGCRCICICILYMVRG